MKAVKTVVSLFVIGVCLTSAQAANAGEFGLSVRTWFPSLDGKVQKGTVLDFKDDLGIEKKNLTSVGLIFGDEGKFQFDFDSFSFDGGKNPAAVYSFAGTSYNPADHVKAKSEFSYIAAKWLPTYNAKSDHNFSWLFGISNFKIKTKLNASGKNAETTFKSYAPIVGARYEIGTTRPTSYYGEIAASVTGGTKYSYASEVGAKWHFSEKTDFVAGYRYLAIKSGADDGYAKMSLSGPFIQLNYRF